jgi:hypothetical protein
MSEKSDEIETTVGVPEQITSFWTDAAESGADFIILYWLSPTSAGVAYDVTHFRLSQRKYADEDFTTSDIWAAPRYSSEEVQDWANGLEPATSYTFKVAACNKWGCGDDSYEISATTNYTEVSLGYQVKSNMTIVAQWCVNYNLDCGLFINSNTWTEAMGDCFIETVVQWLMWHSTFQIEKDLKNEAIEQAVVTEAPTPDWGGNYTMADNVTVIDTTDEDWEDLDDYCEEDPSIAGCMQPTHAPSMPPIVQCSSDGYFNDPGALNGSANGSKHLYTGNVSITGTTDFNYVIEYTNTSSGQELCWEYECNREWMYSIQMGKPNTYCTESSTGVYTVGSSSPWLSACPSMEVSDCAQMACDGRIICEPGIYGMQCALTVGPTTAPSYSTPAPTTPYPTLAPSTGPSRAPTASYGTASKAPTTPTQGPTYATISPTSIAPTTPAPSEGLSQSPTTAQYTSDTVTGINIDYEVTTGTEEQADTVLDIVTANDDTTSNDDSLSFSSEFASTASSSYSAYTGSQTYDTVDGAYEAEDTSEDTTGLYVALLAALVVIVCLIAFILFGWYKRHKLQEYFERRERVKNRFKKATATIGQMKRLGKLTAVLKMKDNAFSYENLEAHHKSAASDLLNAVQAAGGNVAAEQAAVDAENAAIKRQDQYFKSSGNEQYKNADPKTKAEMVLTEIEARKETQESDTDSVARTLDELRKTLEWQNASDAERQKMEEDKLRKRREALKARRAKAAEAVVSGAPPAAAAAQAAPGLFDEEAELKRVKDETERSQAYLNASAAEQKALMTAKLNERKAMLRARRAGNAIHDDLVKERVEAIIKSAADTMNFTIAELDSADEDEIRRCREETEKSIIYQDKSLYEQKEYMRNKLEQRRAELLAARKKEAGGNQLDHEIVDTIMERASSALMQELQAEAYDEEAELARVKHEYETSQEYARLSAEQQRAKMLEKLDGRKAAIRARHAEQRAIAKAQEDEMAAQNLNTKDTANEIAQIRTNEIAVILSKVEENVIDACHATQEASTILGDFKQAQEGLKKGSLESQLAQKAILQERLRERRDRKLQEAQAKAAEAGEDPTDIEAPALSEKWREVEDDLVEQALESFANEIGDLELTTRQTPDDSQQMAVLARVMWQLDRDMAHADELRNKEWASTEAASILKSYDQAAKRAEASLAEQKKEQRQLLDNRIAKRKAERTRKKVQKLWTKGVSNLKATMGMARNPNAVDSGMRALNQTNQTEPLMMNI